MYAVRPGRVLALDALTGDLQWEKDMGNPILASPVVRDGTVYIGVGDNNLYALDIANGAVLWSFTTDDWVIAAVLPHRQRSRGGLQGQLAPCGGH